MMINCKEASKLISQSLDRQLTLRERFSLKLHLMICEFCRQFSQHLQAMRVALRQMVGSIENNDSIELPSTAKARIANILDAHRTN
jgi:hypothetical protein